MSDSSEVADNGMYDAIGRATTAWQMTEDALRDLFMRLVVCTIAGSVITANPRSLAIVGNIFYSFTNFRARVDMIGSLIEDTVYDAKLLDEWTTIKNKVLRIYKRRNTLAHSHVWGNETHGLTMIKPSIFVRGGRSLNLVQIQAAERSFKKTAEQIIRYAIAINRYLVSANTKRGE